MKTRQNLTIILLLLLFTQHTYGQTLNQSYELAGMQLAMAQVVPGVDTNAMFFVADVLDPSIYPSTYAPQQLLVTKTDHSGNVIKAILVDTPLERHRIVETSDSGLLIVAEPVGDYSLSLYILKFDKNLNLQWIRKKGYPSFYAIGIYGSNVDIQKVTVGSGHSAKEEYVILFGAQSYYTNEHVSQNDMSIGVLRIRQNGTELWNHIYSDSRRMNDSASTVWDMPNSLTIMPDPTDTTHTKNWFPIAGCRYRTPVSGPYSMKTFSFILDDNGHIVVNYRIFNTVGTDAIGPDVMWDGVNSKIVYAYSENISNVPAANLTNSTIGLLRTSSILNPVNNRYYFNNGNSNTDIPSSIMQSSDHNYIIHNFSNEVATGNNSTGILKVASGSLNPVWAKLYNDLQFYDWSDFHRTDAKDYNYMMPTIATDVLHPTNQVRLIKTDATGVACGDDGNEFQYIDSLPSFSDSIYEYVSDSIFTKTLQIDTTHLNIYYCDTSSPGYYRLAQKINDFSVQVNPTLITSQGQNITCSITSPEDTYVEIYIMNVLGQVVYRKQEQVNKGMNMVSIDGTILSTGLNIIRVSNSDKVLNISKIIVED